MKKNNNIHNITIKFTKEEFENAIDKAFDKKKNDIKMDGFRKGKVPKDIYFKKVGKESLYMEAIDTLLPTAYDKAIKENNLEPIIDPKVDIKSIGEDGVELEFVITTMPEVEIKKYKGLKIKKEEAKITKEEIDHEINHLLGKYSELVVKEFGEVEAGNIAVIDFEGFKNNNPFEGGKGENYPLEIGSKTFVPGFEEQLIGMKKDEEKDIKLTFPENYHVEDLKNQEVVFKVKVNEIKEKVTRELDEEFFEDLGLEGITSEDTLRKEIEKNIKANKQHELEEKYIDEILAKIAEQTTTEIPEEIKEEEIKHMIKKFEEQVRMQGLSLEAFFEITKSTEEDLRNQLQPEAEKHIIYRFIIDKIKKEEKIEVSEKEANEEADELCKRYEMDKNEFLSMYGGIEMLKYELEVRKVIEFLKENN